jgi:hypothetical protein
MYGADEWMDDGSARIWLDWTDDGVSSERLTAINVSLGW